MKAFHHDEVAPDSPDSLLRWNDYAASSSGRSASYMAFIELDLLLFVLE